MRWGFWRRDRDRELSEEISAHLKMAIMDRVRRGETVDDATAAVRREFGNLGAVKEVTRSSWSLAWLEPLTQDLRYALRDLRRSPGLTATIVLTLGLGVGVNAAMFTVVDRVFFQAPPGVVRPDAVRRIYRHERDIGGAYNRDSFGAREFNAFRAAASGAAELEGYDTEVQHALGDPGERLTVAYVTPGYFRLLGVHPASGRFPSADEQRYGDPRNVVVLSHSLLQRSFGSDSSIIGRSILVDTIPFTVIGVAQRGFDGVDVDVVDLWVPLAAHPRRVAQESGALYSDFNGAVQVLARLNDGVDAAAVDARLTLRERKADEEFRSRDSLVTVTTQPILQARGPELSYDSNIRNRSLAIRLAGVALIVLIIATSNVASLLLMRALRRRREIGVRLALGISRRRLAAQLLTESTLLGAIAGAFALLITWWGGATLRAMVLSNIRWPASVIDRRIVIAAAALALVAGFAAGLAPAWLAMRGSLADVLKSSAPEAGRPGSHLRVTLLVTQAALSMMLLAGAGVFVQSLRRAMSVELGFDADRLITARNVFAASMAPAQFDAALAQIRALPSVQSAAMSHSELRGGATAQFRLPGGDSVGGRFGPQYDFVEDDYFSSVGFRLVTGRVLSPDDAAGTEPVAVITESMARGYWHGRNPIGTCFYSLPFTLCVRVVGVIRDVRWNISGPVPYKYFRPASQSPYRGDRGLFLTVRTRGTPSIATVSEIQRILAPLPHDALYAPVAQRVSDRLEPQTHPWRVAATLFLLFGILALVSATAGVYGLVAYDVTQRTREIGIRVALGASARSVLRLVLGSGLRVILVGVAAGIGAALLSGRVIASLLFETSPYEPGVLVATAATLVIVAVLASLLPAWRATHVDPVIALRAE